ncbi:NAD(P)-dependent oxidoreductase [uncultured Clostridium sp.]|uniref:NAD(P)-dependent oxidoreductase n=1 Tax=uncultured Clostridium sp. TaxID=59620 RepID=UPI00260C5C4B|nr:NAD(P)-dependent oxidoreductase [uncultured Clostridium sp.]
MSRDFKENIPLEYLNIALYSKKIKVLIIGGGNAALIKVRGLLKSKAEVTVLSKEFIEELEKMNSFNKIEHEYNVRYLNGHNLIIICVENKILIEKIKLECESLDKLYLNCSEGTDGDFVIQSTVSTKNINLGLNIKNKNPKGSVFLKNKIENYLLEFEPFIEYTTNIRNTIKDRNDKKVILNFIHEDDFKYIFDKGKANYVLEMFFNDIV